MSLELLHAAGIDRRPGILPTDEILHGLEYQDIALDLPRLELLFDLGMTSSGLEHRSWRERGTEFLPQVLTVQRLCGHFRDRIAQS